MPKIGPKWAKNRSNGSFWGDFGPCLGRSGVTLGSLRDHFGIVLASFWGRFGVVLTPFWGLFGLFLGYFWTIFGPFLAYFFWHVYGHFAGVFSVMFCEVDCKFKQNGAREGKHTQISAKIHQKYAKLCKNEHFFGYKILVLLKKTVKIDVSTYESVQ